MEGPRGRCSAREWSGGLWGCSPEPRFLGERHQDIVVSSGLLCLRVEFKRLYFLKKEVSVIKVSHRVTNEVNNKTLRKLTFLS